MPKISDSAVPSYRKHKASGQAVVTLNGHDEYLGPYGTKASRRLYDRLIAEWLASDRGRASQLGNGMSMAEAMAAYLRHAKSYYVKNGKTTAELDCIIHALRFVKKLYCNFEAMAFTAVALEAVRNSMIEAGLSRKTINSHVGRIRRMFKWLEAKGMVPPGMHQHLQVLDGLRKGRSDARETEPIRPVEDVTVDATLSVLPEIVADMVRLQRFMGCRPEEICNLRPCDVDRSGNVWWYTPATHKMEHHGRERVIAIGPKGQAILLRYLARDQKAHCFRPIESEAKRRAVAALVRRTPLSYGNSPGTNRRCRPKRSAGESYTTDSYRRAIHRACDKAFPAPHETSADPVKLRVWQSEHRWSPNQIRHATATEVRREFGLEAAQAVLGHSSVEVTQVYAERDKALGARVAEAIG